MARPVLSVGWPDETQARQVLLEEFEKLEGGRAEFCRRTGLSRRYLNLIMEWKRTAAHNRVRGYFGWKAVYVPIEDLDEAKERHRQRVGRRNKESATLSPEEGEVTKAIGVYIDGEETWHVIGVGAGDYPTLCGLDANDSVVGQTGTIEAKRSQKVNCRQCYDLWRELKALRLRSADFASQLK